jgi:hypothetical protein
LEWGMRIKYNRNIMEMFLGTAFSVNTGNHEHY